MKLDEIKKYYNLEFVAEKVIKLKTIDFKNKKPYYNFLTFDDYKIKGLDLNILVSEEEYICGKYIICIPTDNDCYEKKMELPTEQDVIEYLNEELDNKEKMCFEISGDRYLEIHRCDDGWDYTIYDSNYKDIDGGVLCNPEYNLLRALETFKQDFIPKKYKFGNLKPIDYLEEI